MVLRRGAGGGITASWGLLAHGVRRGHCGAAAHDGDWVGALQGGNGWEIIGATPEFLGDESADFGGCLCGYSVAGRNCGARAGGGGAGAEDAAGICGGRAPGAEIEGTAARVLRGLAESA